MKKLFLITALFSANALAFEPFPPVCKMAMDRLIEVTKAFQAAGVPVEENYRFHQQYIADFAELSNQWRSLQEGIVQARKDSINYQEKCSKDEYCTDPIVAVGIFKNEMEKIRALCQKRLEIANEFLQQ